MNTIRLVVLFENEDGKDYIERDVLVYSTSISYKGVCQYRSGSANQVLIGSALESFLNGKRGVTWDNMPIPAFTMDDVEVLRKYVKHAKQMICQKLSLL